MLVATAVALMPLMQFRPQLYTYILLAALMALLTRDNYRRSAPLWLAVPMFALWANLHGGFVIGVGSLALYRGSHGGRGGCRTDAVFNRQRE